MAYCQGAKKATVNYSVNGEKKIFIAQENLLPIDVQIEPGYQSDQDFHLKFDGNILTTYPFTFTAADVVPNDPKIEIILLSATWDDCGSIGSFNAPCTRGQVYTYTGQPIIIGSGNSVSGTVINLITPECNISATLGWKSNKDRLRILDKNNAIIFTDIGDNIKLKSVDCDDECPNGYCKIDCEAYPGYCCINEAEIKSLSNQLR